MCGIELTQSSFDSFVFLDVLQAIKQLVHKSNGGLTYIAEYKYGGQQHKMGHLVSLADLLIV